MSLISFVWCSCMNSRLRQGSETLRCPETLVSAARPLGSAVRLISVITVQCFPADSPTVTFLGLLFSVVDGCDRWGSVCRVKF